MIHRQQCVEHEAYLVGDRAADSAHCEQHAHQVCGHLGVSDSSLGHPHAHQQDSPYLGLAWPPAHRDVTCRSPGLLGAM